VVRAAAPDLVVNLGGISSVAYSWDQPVLTGDVSGLGAGRLLELAWQHQERSGRRVSVVQASSAEIFGDPANSPQDESTPIRPASPYGAAKAYAHALVGVYRARGLAASSLVLYNHESPRRPPSFVTRKITQAAARISAGLETTLVLGNLDARRDWGWAPDYVDAMVRALRAPDADDYVIATGQAHAVRDFVAAAFARAGVPEWERHVEVDQRFVRPADAALLVGDASKARRQLGWAPTVTFDELVGRMVEHDVTEVAETPSEGGHRTS
jgi:GDPmannose 4,6-dehydratase